MAPSKYQIFSHSYSTSIHTKLHFEQRFTRERLDAGAARTNLLHGGRNPQVSRVIYTVGTLDPVSPAQMNEDLNPESPVVFMEGNERGFFEVIFFIT